MVEVLAMAEEIEYVLYSSDEEEDTGSDPDGFESSDDEVCYKDWEPDEDEEDSNLPETSASEETAEPRPPSTPVTRSRARGQPAHPSPSPPASPSKKSRAEAPPPQPTANASTQHPVPLAWKTEKDPDTAPSVSRFEPARPPGVQLNSNTTYTPLELFTLFFSYPTVQVLCSNTNKQAARKVAQGKKYKWTKLVVEEFYKYIGLLLYMAMVKLDTISDYWRQNHLFSLQFPCQIMSRDRYRTISWNLHLSDPDQDAENGKKKGTPKYDKLFRLKPLMDSIKEACKSFYHPHKNLAVDERMVASKAKPTKWGFKLFVLADSRNGYTVDFSVYTGKTDIPSRHSLPYDVVMSFAQPRFLGTGYHIYMDSFYTSPKLFRALHDRKLAACGTYRDNLKGCPQTDVNALTKTSERGSMRWIRDGPMVFVKWMDTREVSVCSTIHEAYSGKTAQRRQRQREDSGSRVPVPCPTPVAEYNAHMGGVDRSDQLIQYYTVQHETMRWYRNLFYHFLDIAITNSYILHKELCLATSTKPLTHRGFMEQLTAELCGMPLHSTPAPATERHIPVPYFDDSLAGLCTKPTAVRRRCHSCNLQGRRKDTPWRCKVCDVALCLQVERNCFAEWHNK